MTTAVRRYRPSPTLEKFHADDSMVRSVMGPIGSGKSVGMCLDVYFRALDMPPGKDGVRRSRWLAVRNTYPELKSTTIRTWEEWMPMAPVVYSTPIRWRWRHGLPDGTILDLEVLFLSVDTTRDIKKLKSFDLTGVWLNESVELTKAVLDMAIGRLARYPAADSFAADYIAACQAQGKPLYWTGVISDTNFCDDQHWYFRLFEEEQPKGYRHWRQPPAVVKIAGEWQVNTGQKPGVPAAENVEHHAKGADYYLDQIPGKSEDWIRGFLCAEYGVIQDGRPVFPEYDDTVHCPVYDLKPIPGIPLLLGWDFGLSPACIIGQPTPRGQLRIIDELVCEYGGLEQFVEDVVRPHLLVYYHGYDYLSWGDPAPGTAQTDARTCYDVLDRMGIPTDRASTNTLEPRIAAVTYFLTRTIGGRDPAFLLSRKAKVLRRGMRGAYKFTAVQTIDGGEVRFKEVPLKNAVSHPCDALQYLALGAREYLEGRAVVKRARAQYHRQPTGAADALAGY